MSEGLKLEQQEGSIPQGWDLISIGEVCAVGGGKTPRKSNDDYWHGSIPWVSPKDFDGITLDETEDKLTQSGVSENSINLYKAGNIAMVVRSGVLRHSLPVAQLELDMAVNQDIKVLQPDTTKITSDYLLNILLYEADRIRASCVKTGTTVESVETAFLKAYKLPLPPLPEQQQIAKILSTVDEQIQQTDEIIEETKELRAGLMQGLYRSGIGNGMFSTHRIGPREIEIPTHWELRTVDELKSTTTSKKAIRGGPPGGRIKKSDRSEYGAKLYVQENVIHNDFERRGDYLSTEKFEELQSAEVDPGDVLITRSGTIGKSEVFPANAQRGILGSSLIRIKVNEDIIRPHYLSQFLADSHTAQSQIKAMSHGGTRTGLNNKIVKSVQVPVPPIDEQDRISEILETVEEKIQQEKQHRDDLKELKRGLMQDLLTGKVRVNTD